MDHFLALLNFFYNTVSVFMFWLSGHEACGISAPQAGIEPTPPALEGLVLTPEPPGKSPELLFFRLASISNIADVAVPSFSSFFLLSLSTSN